RVWRCVCFASATPNASPICLADRISAAETRRISNKRYVAARPVIEQETRMPRTVKMPKGTVTFLFTDVEGSTRMWEQHPRAMQAAIARHDLILREAIEAHGGYVFKTMGDA